VGLDNWSGNTSGNRWQGYSHQQLYDMLHSGPGPAAAGVAADRWSSMAGALSDIQQDISSGVAASGAAWVGTAADSAHGALNPLGQWAEQASSAADVMRISAELQGDLLSKARADMPAPVAIPQQTGQISQLVTAQVDYEMAEATSQIAAQQAFQVMAQYEAGTTDNTDTLGDFGEPPTLHVDTTPITGVAVRGRIQVTQPPRRLPRPTPTAGRAAPAPIEEPTGTAGSTSTKAPTEPVAPIEETESPTPTATTEGAPPATEPTTPGTTSSAAPTPTSSTSSSTPSAASSPSSAESGPATAPSAAEATPSPGATPTENLTGVPPTRSTSTSRDKSAAPGSVATPRIGGIVPSARRPNANDEEDEEHESKYLIEAEDIYGDRRSYTPPVIGESRSRR
jgi:PPE family protein